MDATPSPSAPNLQPGSVRLANHLPEADQALAGYYRAKVWLDLANLLFTIAAIGFLCWLAWRSYRPQP